jgi:hypothetical protein
VLAASIVGIGFGALAGIVAASIVPRRRPKPTLAAVAAAESAVLAMPGRWSWMRGRVGSVAEEAGHRLHETRLFPEGSVTNLGTRGRDRLRATVEGMWAARNGGSPASGVGGELSGRARQARYVGQLVPIGLALMRNPIVRDLVAQAVARRLRRTAHL